MSTQGEDRTLRIGEVAARAGVTPRTIRYYEERGLLPAAAERPKGSHRLYGEADVARLNELVHLRDLLGLSLEELVELAEAESARAALRDQWFDDPSDEERRRIVDEALGLVARQLELVRARRQRLAEFAGELEDKRGRLERRRRELGGA
jgi:MerR family transcriptional regulator, repressor of the yfmOP operon